MRGGAVGGRVRGTLELRRPRPDLWLRGDRCGGIAAAAAAVANAAMNEGEDRKSVASDLWVAVVLAAVYPMSEVV